MTHTLSTKYYTLAKFSPFPKKNEIKTETKERKRKGSVQGTVTIFSGDRFIKCWFKERYALNFAAKFQTGLCVGMGSLGVNVKECMPAFVYRLCFLLLSWTWSVDMFSVSDKHAVCLWLFRIYDTFFVEFSQFSFFFPSPPPLFF